MRFLRPAGSLRGVLVAGCFVVAKYVAAARLGLQEWLAGLFAKFATEAVYVDFDEVGEGIEGFVPDVLGDFRTANDAADVARKKFEQRVLLRSEGDGTRAASRGL